jgi:hypothetical protein
MRDRSVLAQLEGTDVGPDGQVSHQAAEGLPEVELVVTEYPTTWDARHKSNRVGTAHPFWDLPYH